MCVTFELEMRFTMINHRHLTLSDCNDIQLGIEHGKASKLLGNLY